MGLVTDEGAPRNILLANKDTCKNRHEENRGQCNTTTMATAATSGATNSLSNYPSATQSAKPFNPETKKTSKKSVRIDEEIELIPLLTSGSFFHKSPKPTVVEKPTIASGWMRSVRIVKDVQYCREQGDDDLKSMVPKSTLWWTKEERREIIQANQKTSRDFKRFHPTKVREANLVYDDIVMGCCCMDDEHETIQRQAMRDRDDEVSIYDFFQTHHRTNRMTLSSSKKRKRSSVNAKNSPPNPDGKISFQDNLEPDDFSDVSIDLPTSVRGLEWGVLPDAKRYRKAHARTVLDWQDILRCRKRRRKSARENTNQDDDIDDENLRDQDQDHVLGAKARASSRRSCILARVFGKSDALSVREEALTRTATNTSIHRSQSPTPSIMSTSGSSSEGEDDDDDGESSSDSSDSDSDGEEDDCYTPSSTSYTHSSYKSSMATNSSHRRMFRPRMMPPMSWR